LEFLDLRPKLIQPLPIGPLGLVVEDCLLGHVCGVVPYCGDSDADSEVDGRNFISGIRDQCRQIEHPQTVVDHESAATELYLPLAAASYQPGLRWLSDALKVETRCPDG